MPAAPDRRYQPSIQSAVSSVCENGTTCAVPLPEPGFTISTGINGFVEPNFHFYEVNYPLLDQALANFQAKLPFNAEEHSIIARCREMRISRVLLSEERVRQTVWDPAFLTGNGPNTVTDVPYPRDCFRKIDALALRYLCHSVSAGAGKKGRAYFCSPYEILPGKVSRQSPLSGMCLVSSLWKHDLNQYIP